MAGTFMRAAFRGAVLLASASCAASAWAQVPPAEAAQPRATIDENGVDLSTGTFVLSPVSMSIGGARGLTWSPGRNDLTRTRMVPTNYPETEFAVSIGGDATLFTKVNGAYVAKERNGYTLTYDSSSKIYTYTTATGDTATFFTAGSTNYTARDGRLAYPARSIVTADKAKITFAYAPTQWKTCPPNVQYSSCPTSTTWYRPMGIVGDDGYSLNIRYKQEYISTGYRSPYPPVEWRTPARYSLSRRTACTPSASEICAMPEAYPYIDVQGNQYTDAAGRVTTASTSAIRFPGSTSDDVSISYSGGKVSAVVATGVTTAYSFVDSGDTRTATVTRGSLPPRVLTFRIATLQPLSERWQVDPSGPTYTRSYTYDPQTALLLRITEPEGNYVAFGYDTRGNATETRLVSKTPGTPPDLVTRASYDATCANAVTCNQPNTTTDARGQVTSYAYDPVHGGVTSVKAPAPDPGNPTLRPETRYNYAQLDSSGVASGSGTWTLTGVSACATAVSCAGTADERRTTLAYGYGLNVTSVTQAAGAGSLSATTSASYDALGNLVAVDGPLPGNGDTVRMRYDVLRRPVGTTGSDPDGGGVLLPRATRTTYNADGTVRTVEQGTDATPAAAGFDGFASLQQVTSSYDGYHRKVKDVMTAGGQTFAVGQQSYDALSRLDCTVTRMDSGQWSNQPGACSPQTSGANGPDRVARQSYDAGGRLSAVTSGYGTPEASTERVVQTATGRTASVTDANGNVTAYAYDGFDRPWRTCYQMASSAACAGSPGDYEQASYAANGDLTSRRLRDGTSLGYGYDALGRLTYLTVPSTGPDDTNTSYSYDLLGRLTLAAKNPTNRTSFSYDALDRKVGESNYYYALTSAYDAAGRRTRLTWNDGFFVSYDYDASGNMTAIRENGGLALATFGYDALGRRTSLTRGNGTTTAYAYDAASRLTGLNLNGGNQPQAITLSYTPAGQIASRTGSNDAYAFTQAYNVDRGYVANGLNQYTQSGAIVPTYDAKGNLTSAGPQTYQYTSQNRLWNAPGVGVLYGDSLDRLDYIQAEGVLLAHDGPEVVSEVACCGTSIARRYVFGPGTDEPLVWYEGPGTGDRRYLHADERGSIVAVSNAAGTAIAVNRYDEYGIPQAGNLGRFQYTGQNWIPSIGMYDYKARTYSPTLGRFLQTDPIGYGDGLNWYNYVGGDPVNSTDPSGMALYRGTWRCPSDSMVQLRNGSCFRKASVKVGDGADTGASWVYASAATLDCGGKGIPGGGYGMCDDLLPLPSPTRGGGGRGSAPGGVSNPAPVPAPQKGLLDRAKDLYCSLPSLGLSTSARGYDVLGGGFAFDFAFDPQSGRAGFSAGIDVGVGFGGEVRFSAGNSATLGRNVANGPSGSVGANLNFRAGPVAGGASTTLIGRNGPGFGGVSAGIRPGGTGLTVNANLGARGGYGGQILPSCGSR